MGEWRQHVTVAIGLSTWGCLWLLAAGTALGVSREPVKGLFPRKQQELGVWTESRAAFGLHPQCP